MQATMSNLPEALRGKSVAELRDIVNTAIESYNIDRSWRLVSRDPNAFVAHIDAMCNEFNMRVADNGSLIRLVKRTYLIQIDDQQLRLFLGAIRAVPVMGKFPSSPEEMEGLEALADMLEETRKNPGKPGDVHGFTL
jgi:hypothetical protein